MSSVDPKKNEQARKRREKALWGLAYFECKSNGQWGLRPRWGALGVLFGALIVLVYLGAVFGAYWLNRYYRECPETSLRDMFLYVIPNRIPHTKIVFMPEFINKHIANARIAQQEKLGDLLHKKIKDDAGGPKSPHDVLNAARMSPHNIAAQFDAAVYLLYFDRVEDAFKVLDDTLPDVMRANEQEAKRWTLEYAQRCFQNDQDKRIIAAAKKWLDASDITSAARINLATSYAEALFLRGDIVEASNVLSKYKLETTLSGFLLKAQILWENGEQERAITLLRNQIAATPAAAAGKDKLLYTLAKFYWEQEKSNDASKSLDEIGKFQPSDFRARIYMLPLLPGEANAGRRTEIIEDIFQRFGSNEAAMLSLGSYAADQGNITLQRRIDRLAVENRFARLANFRLLIIETLLTAGHHDEAIAHINKLFEQKPNWLRELQFQEQFETLRMLAYFASGQADMGRIVFDQILTKTRMPVSMMVSIARRLLKLNRPNEAKRLLTAAYTRNHYNQGTLLELVKIDLKSESTETLGEHMGYLLEARRPPRYVLTSAYTHLASDRFIFTPNRDQLIDRITEMLRTRVLPQSEIEKNWPTTY
jgi:uncharacterized protein HemY